MDHVVVSFAKGLAGRTSRRGLFSRSTEVLLALVGSGALLNLLAAPAQANDPYPAQDLLDTLSEAQADALLLASGCCFCWEDCYVCGRRYTKIYDCPCGCNTTTGGGGGCRIKYVCSRNCCCDYD